VVYLCTLYTLYTLGLYITVRGCNCHRVSTTTTVLAESVVNLFNRKPVQKHMYIAV